MKCILATTTSNMDFHTTSSLEVDSLPTSTFPLAPTSKSKGKYFFYDRAIDIFEKMAKNGASLMKEFEKPNALLEGVYY
jgi:hypothetical protein